MTHDTRALERAIAEAFDSSTHAGDQAPADPNYSLSRGYSLKVPVKMLVEMPEWKGIFTESAIRGLIHKSSSRFSSRGVIPGNGLIEAGALIRIGRKILIDCDHFREFIEAHRVNTHAQQSVTLNKESSDSK